MSRLIILSDLWGLRQNDWWHSYSQSLTGQFKQVRWFDSSLLAHIDRKKTGEQALHQAFVNGGIDTAVEELIRQEAKFPNQPAHILAHSVGGVIAWQAGLKGLKMQSLTAISATRLRFETEAPTTVAGGIQLLYGVNDPYRPTAEWLGQFDLRYTLVKDKGHDCYKEIGLLKNIFG